MVIGIQSDAKFLGDNPSSTGTQRQGAAAILAGGGWLDGSGFEPARAHGGSYSISAVAI